MQYRFISIPDSLSSPDLQQRRDGIQPVQADRIKSPPVSLARDLLARLPD
jgi:hypothetical protein